VGLRPSLVAALAMVGWYLMLPIDLNQPLADWYQWGSYETKTECETTKRKVASDAEGRHDQMAAALFLAGRCISSDDPRLKA
jgi:hypothetical protein